MFENIDVFIRCPITSPCRQFQTRISQIMPMNSNIKEFENLSVEKKTLSSALGFEPMEKEMSDACVTQ